MKIGSLLLFKARGILPPVKIATKEKSSILFFVVVSVCHDDTSLTVKSVAVYIF
jgi:hypothetical protein